MSYDEENSERDETGIVVRVPAFEVSGFSTESIEQAVVEAITERLLSDRDSSLRKSVQEAVGKVVAETTTTMVSAAVERTLAEGWQEFDRWGDPKGERFTLRSRIEKVLSAKERIGGSYNAPELTLIERLTQKAIDETVRNAFDKELEYARTKFRAAVDTVVQAKLAETLKSALGLR